MVLPIWNYIIDCWIRMNLVISKRFWSDIVLIKSTLAQSLLFNYFFFLPLKYLPSFDAVSNSDSDLLRCLFFYCYVICCSVYTSPLTSLLFCFCFGLFCLCHSFSILLNLFHLFWCQIDVRLLLFWSTSFSVALSSGFFLSVRIFFWFFLSVWIFPLLSRFSFSFIGRIFLSRFYSPYIGCIFLSDYVIFLLRNFPTFSANLRYHIYLSRTGTWVISLHYRQDLLYFLFHYILFSFDVILIQLDGLLSDS